MTRDAPTPDEIVRSMPDASAEDLVEMAAEWGVAMTTADVERLRQEQRARLFTAGAAPPVAYDHDDDGVDDHGVDDGVDAEAPLLAAEAGDLDGPPDEHAALAAGASPEHDAPARTEASAGDPTRRRRILVTPRASTPEPQPVKRRPGRPRKDGNGAQPPTRDPAPAASAGNGAEERAFRQAAIALVLTSGGKHARAILDDVLAKIRDAGRLRGRAHRWARQGPDDTAESGIVVWTRIFALHRRHSYSSIASADERSVRRHTHSCARGASDLGASSSAACATDVTAGSEGGAGELPRGPDPTEPS